MVKDVKIGDQTVAMAANAATPFLYVQIFHDEDPLQILSKLTEENQMAGAAVLMKLGYVMAMHAQKSLSEMLKLKTEDFYAWLERFDYMDLLSAAKDIRDIYFHQTKTMSELSASKKKDE